MRASAVPLVLFIHGFPDQWYSWRYQMAALADDYQVVAISQRGYNRSDKPKGVENYDIEHLTGDVAAVIRHLDSDSAIIVGHDWGGIVSWFFGERYPEMIDALVIYNRPHAVSTFRGSRRRQVISSVWTRSRWPDGARSRAQNGTRASSRPSNGPTTKRW